MTSNNLKLGFFAALTLFAAACSSAGDEPGASNAAIAARGAADAGDAATCRGPTPMCAAGTVLVDKDGDGCADGCAPKTCALAILCDQGTQPVDRNGDGCDDACKPVCPAILCQVGYRPVDANGDGCKETCEDTACPPIAPCQPGQTSVDSNNDGCVDSCL